MIRALAITGPTASGKTSLSIEVARTLGCEIICLDSMQIYKRMDIGTAKATAEEQKLAKHHMLDFLSPTESFSAKAYKDMAMKVARDIVARGKIPLFVGGTGLYLSTVMRPDVEEPPESDPEYRRRIEQTLTSEEKRIELWERLRQIDPESAEAVHYNNTRRVLRALEIFDATGKTKSYFDALTKQKNKEIETTHITLDFHDRELLYRRINDRVDAMMDEGLYAEVKGLIDDGLLEEHTTASQAIGYKEMTDAIALRCTKEEAVERIKQASRNYAKRQLTWFRNMDGARSVYIDDENGRMRSPSEILSECIAVFSKTNENN